MSAVWTAWLLWGLGWWGMGVWMALWIGTPRLAQRLQRGAAPRSLPAWAGPWGLLATVFGPALRGARLWPWLTVLALWVLDPAGFGRLWPLSLGSGDVQGAALLPLSLGLPAWVWALPPALWGQWLAWRWSRLRREAQARGAAPRRVLPGGWSMLQGLPGQPGQRPQHYWCAGLRRASGGRLLVALEPVDAPELAPLWVEAAGVQLGAVGLSSAMKWWVAPARPGAWRAPGDALSRRGQLALMAAERPGESGAPGLQARRGAHRSPVQALQTSAARPLRAELFLSVEAGPLTLGEPGVCYLPLSAVLAAAGLLASGSAAPRR